MSEPDTQDTVFEVLWREIEPRLATYFYRQGCHISDIEDLLQETGIAAYKGFSTLKDEKKFSSWILTIARRVFFSYVSEKKKSASEYLKSGVIPDKSANYEAIIIETTILRILENLGPIDQQIFIMSFQGCGYKEIAEKFHISKHQVFRRIRNAKEVLLKAMKPLLDSNSISEPELK